MNEFLFSMLLLSLVIALGIYLIPKMEKQLGGDYYIDTTCPSCGAPGKIHSYGTYNQFEDFTCDYCGHEEEDVF